VPAPFGRIATTVMVVGLGLTWFQQASAQEARRSFNIGRGPAPQAIAQFVKQADVNVLAGTSNMGGVVTNAVSGQYTVEEALAKLIAGTGLTGRVNPNGSVFIVAPTITPVEKTNGGSTRIEPPDMADEGPQIVVTGSRLAHRGYQAPSPVSVVDAQELKLSGAQTVETLLVQNPQFSGNIYNAAGNGGSLGVAAINMRGLGEQRNLILVNGRRYTITGTDTLTDLNTIPAPLIKRVEIVTGGSSAVYGSDAIAGVVNFILKNDFKGVELVTTTKRDQHTNTPANQLTLTVGGSLGGAGNAVLSLDYFNRGGILRGQFPWAAQGLADGCVTAASYSDSAAGVPLAVPAGQTCSSSGGRAGLIASNSSATPAGRLFGIPTYGSPQSSTGLNAALVAAGLQNMSSYGLTFNPGSNLARAAIDPDDRYNNTPYNFMQTPMRRVMANSFVDYKLGENSSIYFEGHWSNNRSAVQIAPGAVLANVLINTNNPYLSAAAQELVHQLDLAESGTITVRQGTTSFTTTPGDGLAVLGLNRRLTEAGPRTSVVERNAYRSVVGWRGEVTDQLNYDLYYSYARTAQSESQGGNFSLSKLQQSMLSVDGVAPLLNPFGANAVSAAALQAISVSTLNTATNEQQVVAGNLTGSTTGLSAGPIDFNTGFEWRGNRVAVTPDALNASGDVAGQGMLLPVSGSTNVKELYAEIRLPLLRDVPFARQLSLNGAARFSNYSLKGFGGVFTHSVGLQWQPAADLTMRAQLQRAIRAPNIGELYGAQNPITPTVNDPCANRVAAVEQTAAIRALCVVTGVPESAVFTTAVQPNAQVATLTGGNANLRPETPDPTALGLFNTPHALYSLGVSVDRYKNNRDGAIAPIGGSLQNVFDLCYKVVADALSPYCKAIHRDSLTGAVLGGASYVDQSLLNTGGIKTSGIDLNANYSFAIGYAPFGGVSRIEASTGWSYTREYTFTPVQNLPQLKNYCVGSFGTTCGAPAPRWKGVARISWHTGQLVLSLHDRFTGAVTRDTYLLPLRQGLTPPDLDDVSAAKIKAQQYFDLSFTLHLPKQFEIHGGINNLFDKAPPLLGTAAPTWGVGTSPGTYELYGRSFFFGLTKRM
jgi:iron complex outermembrane receptor protein